MWNSENFNFRVSFVLSSFYTSINTHTTSQNGNFAFIAYKHVFKNKIHKPQQVSKYNGFSGMYL